MYTTQQNGSIPQKIVPYHTIHRNSSYVDKLCRINQDWVIVRRIPKRGLEDSWRTLNKELEFLTQIDNTHFLKPKFCLQSERYLYTVLPFEQRSASYSDIVYLGHSLSHNQLVGIFAQLLQALHVLQQNGCYHGGLNPETCRITEKGRLVVVNTKNIRFTNSRKHKIKKSIDQDSVYIAPEIFDMQYDQTPSVDLWSLGVLLYEAYFHRPPYEVYLCGSISSKIHSINYKIERCIPKESVQLIKKLLRKPADRVGKMSLSQIKKHQYFTGIKWDSLALGTLKQLGYRDNVSTTSEAVWIQMYQNKSYQVSPLDQMMYPMFKELQPPPSVPVEKQDAPERILKQKDFDCRFKPNNQYLRLVSNK